MPIALRALATAACVILTLWVSLSVRAESPEHKLVSGEVEIPINGSFPVRAHRYALLIGETLIINSRYPESGRLTSLTFIVSQEEYAALPDGVPMRVVYGRSNAVIAELGPFTRNASLHQEQGEE